MFIWHCRYLYLHLLKTKTEKQKTYITKSQVCLEVTSMLFSDDLQEMANPSCLLILISSSTNPLCSTSSIKAVTVTFLQPLHLLIALLELLSLFTSRSIASISVLERLSYNRTHSKALLTIVTYYELESSQLSHQKMRPGVPGVVIFIRVYSIRKNFGIARKPWDCKSNIWHLNGYNEISCSQFHIKEYHGYTYKKYEVQLMRKKENLKIQTKFKYLATINNIPYKIYRTYNSPKPTVHLFQLLNESTILYKQNHVVH